MFVDFSKYSGFIFDLDGTLIDSMPYHISNGNRSAENMAMRSAQTLSTNVVAFPHATSF